MIYLSRLYDCNYISGRRVVGGDSSDWRGLVCSNRRSCYSRYVNSGGLCSKSKKRVDGYRWRKDGAMCVGTCVIKKCLQRRDGFRGSIGAVCLF